MVDTGRVPLAEAHRQVGGQYLRLWRAVTSGEIPAMKRHCAWWVRVSDVEAYLAAKGQAGESHSQKAA